MVQSCKTDLLNLVDFLSSVIQLPYAHFAKTASVMSNECMFNSGLFLQGEAFEPVSSSSAHAQSVAKAKYEFLFGKTEDTSSADSGTFTFLHTSCMHVIIVCIYIDIYINGLLLVRKCDHIY